MLPVTRKCYICGVEQPIENYFNNKSQSAGKRYECKTCCKTYVKHWQYNNPIKYWARYTYRNHVANGFELKFTKDELIKLATETTVCAMCGKPLIYNNGTNGKQTLSSPSLDRIYNDTILTLDNVWIICLACNNHKSSKPMNEFVSYCKMISERFG